MRGHSDCPSQVGDMISSMLVNMRGVPRRLDFECGVLVDRLTRVGC